MLQTKNQSRVSISGLTYNNLIEDAYNALKDSDAFKNNFTDFTSNTAERMIVELYAYVASQLANRMDQMGNELFVDTASASGLSRLLKLVGAKVDFPSAAETEVTVSTSSNSNTIMLSYGIDGGSSITTLAFTDDSFKSVSANNGTNWEFIDRKVGEDGKYVYDYTTQFSFTPNSETYKLYEGTTRSLIYTINSVNTDIITLNSAFVVKDSVRIYYKNKVLKAGTTNTYEIKEFKKVENFFTTEALTARTGVFTERNIGNGRCEIWLKPYYDESTNVSDIGQDLLIMYRTGSGSNGNISPGAINKTEQFNIIGNDRRITGRGQINIKNTTAGNGGADELTTNQIRASVLQEVRNTKIAVTEEDYEYLFPKYDSKIALIKCYGEKNDEIADLSETYGYYVNPLYVWLLVLKSNTELESLYKSNGSDILTDIINDIQLSTFDINPRFDEKYQINRASLNNLFKKDSLKDYLTESTNVYSLPINAGFEILKAGDCQVTVTTNPYIESSQSSKKGVGCFRRYDNVSVSGKTWEGLKDLTSASKGDVYIITNADYYGEINNRWECIQAFSSKINPSEVLTYWTKVDFEYIYDNLVPEGSTLIDKLYIEGVGTEGSVSFNSIISKIESSFIASWEDFQDSSYWIDNKLRFPTNTFITINGRQFSIGGYDFASAENLAEFINNHMTPTTNMVTLKQNIVAISDLTGSPNDVSIVSKNGYVSGTPAMVITGHDGIARTIGVSVTGVNTYGGLVSAINSALASSSLGTTYKAILYPAANDCYDLALISAQSFTYNDRNTDGASSIYNYLLNNDPSALPLSSFKYAITDGEDDEPWGSNFYDAAEEIATVDSDGNIRFGFDDEGNCSLNIIGDDAIKELFGLDPTKDREGKTVLDRRTISVVLNSSSKSASINISMTSNTDRIEDNLYINIFGSQNDRIKLGSYYEKENIDSIYSNQTVRNLLTRKPIKNLYATNYIVNGNESNLDKYGSNYQLKFSTGPVGELTFNQLSSESSPAYIKTIKSSEDTMTVHNSGEYLYIKVDNIDFTTPGPVTVGSQTVNVEEHNGYAKFDMHDFNSWTTFNFVDALVNTFKTTGAESTPLLRSRIEFGKVIVSTTSSAYYSSIDFGNTNNALLYELFGLNEIVVVHSAEGQINAEQIKYSFFSLRNNIAAGRSIVLTVDNKTATINIGYSMSDFQKNIASSTVKDYVVLDNNRIVLKDLTEGKSIKLDFSWDSKAQYDSFKEMFSPETWEDFMPITGTEASGSATCTYTNVGDYYISLESDSQGNNNYYFVVQNETAYPYGDVYFHMYEDYSNDHIISQDGGIIDYTDEYNWNRLMTDKRVMLTEHVYKQPRFVPFDLAITVYLPNNQQNSSVNYEEEITNFLREEYGPFADTIGKEIVPEDIIFKIKEKFSYVRTITIDYIGYDMTNSTTNQSSLITKFNQKHIIASTVSSMQLVLDPETRLLSQKLITTQGLKVTIKYQA